MPTVKPKDLEEIWEEIARLDNAIRTIEVEHAAYFKKIETWIQEHDRKSSEVVFFQTSGTSHA